MGETVRERRHLLRIKNTFSPLQKFSSEVPDDALFSASGIPGERKDRGKKGKKKRKMLSGIFLYPQSDA